jgi:hypothetical protein
MALVGRNIKLLMKNDTREVQHGLIVIDFTASMLLSALKMPTEV